VARLCRIEKLGMADRRPEAKVEGNPELGRGRAAAQRKAVDILEAEARN
jgi:hypothetical protein